MYKFPKDLTRGYLNNRVNLTLLFILIGIIFRLFHFFDNRSLWTDELYLSASIVKMNYLQLATEPLVYQQKAPIGFLWLTKFFSSVIGGQEMGLRFFSLLTGVLSLFLFVPVARYFLGNRFVWLAVGILALAPPLIYHSVEAKQYGTELFATTLVLYLYIKFGTRTDRRSLLYWALSGMLIIWFSYAAIFTLVGVAFALFVSYLSKKDWLRLKKQLVVFIAWALSFLLNYFLFTYRHAESKWIVYWFDYYRNFMPLPPTSIADLTWFPLNFYRMMDYPLGLLWNFTSASHHVLQVAFKMPFLPILCFLIGSISLLKTKKQWLVLYMPLFITLMASGLKLYPLTERFFVFAAPILIILIVLGNNFLINLFRNHKIAYLLPILLVFGPIVNSLEHLLQPGQFLIHKKSYQREALNYIDSNYKEGDAVYVYWNNRHAINVYEWLYPFRFKAVQGSDFRKQASNYDEYVKFIQADLPLVGKQRLWVVFNNFFLSDIGDLVDQPEWYYADGGKPNEKIHEFFKTLGNETGSFRSFDVDVHLFELTAPATAR